jgi:nicotinamide-nucleotide amidase
MAADWGLAETGAAGPTGNRYGDAAGHCCLAVLGAQELAATIETGSGDRGANMTRFALAALQLLERALA